jgi:hypothetical protein
MILSDCVLPTRVNQRGKFSGMDSPETCPYKQHFANYAHDIEYVYNSRGFRDTEWPQSMQTLRDAIWCIGDSFTVGIGQPYHHTWPQVLSQQAGVRTINVSMDGASNDWIYRKVQNIMDVIKPKHMVLMWSYTHRREKPDQDLCDEARRVWYSRDSTQQDISHWLDLANQVQTLHPSIVQCSIPNFMPDFDGWLARAWDNVKDVSWPQCPRTLYDLESLPAHIRSELDQVHGCYDSMKEWLCSRTHNSSAGLPEYVIYIKDQLDFARDRHHFDILTSRWVVGEIMQRLLC